MFENNDLVRVWCESKWREPTDGEREGERKRKSERKRKREGERRRKGERERAPPGSQETRREYENGDGQNGKY